MPGNTFTLDAWINPIPDGSSRYLGICGSFSQYFFPAVEGSSPGTGIVEAEGKDTKYLVGWTFQIDTLTSKLQMVGYSRGSWTNLLLESDFIVPSGVWTHVALMSWQNVSSQYVKMFFKNGVPGARTLSDTLYWTNTVSRDSIGTQVHSSAYFYIGAGAKSGLTSPGTSQDQYLNIQYAHKFRGYIREFRLFSKARFPETGFTPPMLPSSTTSTHTTLSTSGTTTGTVPTSTFSTTVPPLINVGRQGHPIGSSSSYDGPPRNAFDGEDDTKWKPSGTGDDWIGIKLTDD
jgi:hypothetical protein